MPWQLAISFSILANIACILVQRKYSLNSKMPPAIASAASYVLGVMPVGLLAGFMLPHAVSWNWQLVMLLVLCSGCMAIANWISFKAVKLMPVAPYQTIGKFTIVVVVALGWLLLDEKLNAYQSLATVLLLIAAIMAIYAPTAQKGVVRRPEPGSVVLALTAATFLAVGLVAEKAMLVHVQVGAVLIVGWGLQTLAMVLLALKDVTRSSLSSFGVYEAKWSALMGVAGGITGSFYVYAINRSDNISLISALTAVALPLSVVGAHILLGEKEKSRLVLPSIGLCFLGLVLMAV